MSSRRHGLPYQSPNPSQASLNQRGSEYMTVSRVDDSNKQKSSTQSLASAGEFGALTVAFFTILIAATILLFIWSNSSLGASVHLKVVGLYNLGTSTTQTDLNILSILNNFGIQLPNVIDVNNLNNLNSPNSSKFEKFIYEILTKIENVENEQQSITDSDNVDLSNPIEFLDTESIVFEFSLVNAVRDFWDSKAYMLAILIALFSGIWPYVKLVLLATCWLVPLKQKTRENILFMLDQLGKFSFIDLYVTLFMMCVFYVVIPLQVKFILSFFFVFVFLLLCKALFFQVF